MEHIHKKLTVGPNITVNKKLCISQLKVEKLYEVCMKFGFNCKRKSACLWESASFRHGLNFGLEPFFLKSFEDKCKCKPPNKYDRE